MNIQGSRWRSLAACAAVVASVALAACSSSSSTSSAPPSTTAPAATTAAATTEPAATTPAASPSGTGTGSGSSFTGAAKQVADNWTAFFDPNTPAAQKPNLVQDGTTTLAPVLAAQATNAQAKLTSAKVSAVTVSGSAATVTWDLLLSGSPVLTNQKGTAVLEGGTWKVSKASFCGLLKLQPPVPAACN
jgi:hypothetical protein